jgi:hypothetical protein
MEQKIGTVPIFSGAGRDGSNEVEKNRDCPYFLSAAEGK